METTMELFQQLADNLPTLLIILLIKIPLALLVWGNMLRVMDKRSGINFRETFNEMPASARADYLGKRNIGAAIICAAIFL
jgi:hypothetical protein